MNPDEMRQLAELLQSMPGIKSVEMKDVKRLAELMRESPEIGSIELKGWFGTGIVMTRTGAGAAGGSLMLPQPQMYAAPPGMSAVYPPRNEPGAATAAAPAPNLKEIKSPMVGTFYKSPEPGADAYVKVGSRVSPGQTVCIIEAMKIMNEIEAEIAGVIREVVADDSQPVEFGQVLYRVDPNG
ncbi:MAG: acetyl-CoA carboxylase biotin carboxyl carrier protein [Gemmatimonadota bacterium]